MKRTGAWLTVYALEQIGARFTFGIPGVHTTELYDALNSSNRITQVLVTHEGGASFMADAVGRLSDSIGVLTVVPAAGLTHAASGIGEAFLDGVPMLVLSGGPRTDTGHRYQLHQMDTHKFMSGLTKATFRVTRHEEVVPTLFKAYEIATSGEPGPVFVELPVNVLLLMDEIGELPQFKPAPAPRVEATTEIARAAETIAAAKHPCIFAGWGARDASNELVRLAEWLEAPVATTLQGLSVFSANHPLHVGFGFGASAVPAAQNAFKSCDCMIAIGTLQRQLSGQGRHLGRCRYRPQATAERARRKGVASHVTREPARADQERQGRLSRELVSPRCGRHRQSRALLRRTASADARQRHHLHRRRQSHLPHRRVDADPCAEERDPADRLQLHGLRRARCDRRQAGVS
jgi:acetolactate synthase-1/2/3 large subunit